MENKKDRDYLNLEDKSSILSKEQQELLLNIPKVKRSPQGFRSSLFKLKSEEITHGVCI